MQQDLQLGGDVIQWCDVALGPAHRDAALDRRDDEGGQACGVGLGGTVPAQGAGQQRLPAGENL